MDSTSSNEGQDWPLRIWGLTLLGGLSGLLIYGITRPDRFGSNMDGAQWRMAIATFFGVGALLLGFLVERSRLHWSAAFAGVGGLLVALTIYWNGPFDSDIGGEPWRIACAMLSVAIAAPLFQGWRDAQGAGERRRWAIPYADAYRHAWTNVVLWFAAWTFVAVCWAMALLLGELFRLIGIRRCRPRTCPVN
ncbi:hypothetical protein [Sphingobium sp.]|uniref:hypothetical protein n=1 Tax=Sphingobium sp. TaxID=1912891 RepID=UPI002C0AB281|nr:hypothetical protein [Sphingobium sp.]HUD94158.1 hypothetical protein [Sphingobium sp.]